MAPKGASLFTYQKGDFVIYYGITILELINHKGIIMKYLIFLILMCENIFAQNSVVFEDTVRIIIKWNQLFDTCIPVPNRPPVCGNMDTLGLSSPEDKRFIDENQKIRVIYPGNL